MNKVEALKIKGNKCVKCNCEFTDLKKAHFHHMRSYNKIDNISNMLNNKVNRCTLETELAKTVVLCEDCHRKLHKTLGKKVYKKDTLNWLKND